MLRLSQVEERAGVKRTKLYAMIAAKSFPAPVKIGGASRWPASVVDAWIADQVRANYPVAA